jgi:hypothetical protein
MKRRAALYGPFPTGVASTLVHVAVRAIMIDRNFIFGYS